MFLSRTALKRATAAAALGLAAFATPSFGADDTKTVYSVTAGVDFTSHFVSYGADVWGGGAHDMSPFSATSSIFGYATVNAAISDEFSAFVNVWSDLNNNTDSSIGDYVQEIDLNVGAAYKWEKLTFSATFGQWMYANDVEGIIDLGVAYDDSELMPKGFALNPSLLVHYRFDPNGGQKDDSAAFVLGVKPAFTFMEESDYPVTVALPASVALFTDEFQGGDGGYGYATVGVVATVPLAFIPPEYGAWTASAGVSYYNTPDDSIPGNPSENFLVSTFSINVGF